MVRRANPGRPHRDLARRVLGAWIKTSSGQQVLDQAAIDTIRRAQPMPAIPSGLPDSLKIEVALGFDPS
jgi:protein TonB